MDWCEKVGHAPFTKKIFLLGPAGSGHTMKLIHNMVCHSCFMATAPGAEVKHGQATLGFLKKAMALGMSEKDYALLYRDFEKIRKG